MGEIAVIVIGTIFLLVAELLVIFKIAESTKGKPSTIDAAIASFMILASWFVTIVLVVHNFAGIRHFIFGG